MFNLLSFGKKQTLSLQKPPEIPYLSVAAALGFGYAVFLVLGNLAGNSVWNGNGSQMKTNTLNNTVGMNNQPTTLASIQDPEGFQIPLEYQQLHRRAYLKDNNLPDTSKIEQATNSFYAPYEDNPFSDSLLEIVPTDEESMEEQKTKRAALRDAKRNSKLRRQELKREKEVQRMIRESKARRANEKQMAGYPTLDHMRNPRRTVAENQEGGFTLNQKLAVRGRYHGVNEPYLLVQNKQEAETAKKMRTDARSNQLKKEQKAKAQRRNFAADRYRYGNVG